MEAKSVFEFRDYKAFLKFIEGTRPLKGRGFRAELSRAAGCQTAYISQVLNSSANFSLEQGQAVGRSLLLGREEMRYLLTLIEYARAGTSELRTHFLELMEEQIQRQLNLKERFKIKEVLSAEDQATYYSDWTYAAIHIAVTIPELGTAEAIAHFFQLSIGKTQKVLRFLLQTRLISEARSGRFTIGTARIHLGRESGLISKHHSNWRLQVLSALERDSERDLHYTSVVSLSRADVLDLKARFVKNIDAFNATVKDSKEETMYCLALDFFSLEKSEV